jgi:flagellar biosynthesis/type III secretory pathway protein FliH
VTLSRARIIPRASAAAATSVASAASSSPVNAHEPERALAGRSALSVGRARLVPKLVANAQTRARDLIQKAHEDAQQILVQARAAADDLILQQQARARADALCLVVGEALELRKRQEELSKSVLDRSIGFAQLLAERLLGAELELGPERVRLLARQALKEAAGARQAIIVAHPRDAAELKAGLFGLGEMLDSIGIEEDSKLARGQLRVETELGVIEADLKGQLERLAVQLKKLLESHASEPL